MKIKFQKVEGRWVISLANAIISKHSSQTKALVAPQWRKYLKGETEFTITINGG